MQFKPAKGSDRSANGRLKAGNGVERLSFQVYRTGEGVRRRKGFIRRFYLDTSREGGSFVAEKQKQQRLEHPKQRAWKSETERIWNTWIHVRGNIE